MSDPSVELAARMPWTQAAPDSWWIVSGRADSSSSSFTDCFARVLPPMVTGHEVPIFEILIYGEPMIVPASHIESAKELMFVYVEEPVVAYYGDDQVILDRSMASN